MTESNRPQRYAGRRTAALERLRRIAEQLGPLSSRIVFVGGAVAPLLQTNEVLPRVRPTQDVDAVIATTSYADLGALRDYLRDQGFAEAPMPSQEGAPLHMHRWIAPANGGLFDLIPVGNHAGGTGGMPDVYAVDSAVSIDLRLSDQTTPCIVRHASAIAFLLLKWAAYDDRGRRDPFESHDLEDIIAVVASRPSIVEECRAAPRTVRASLAAHIRDLLVDADKAEELIAANLPFQPTVVHQVRSDVLRRLNEIAGTDTPEG